jgi:WhiB family transcriptional regulator, redox-sensing transcriptional regulator
VETIRISNRHRPASGRLGPQPTDLREREIARAEQPRAEPLPCQRGHGELWFSELPAELEQAKAYCQPCPLRAACLAGARERAEPCGVWGGEIFHAGAILARKRPRGRPPRTRPDAGQGYAVGPDVS